VCVCVCAALTPVALALQMPAGTSGRGVAFAPVCMAGEAQESVPRYSGSTTLQKRWGAHGIRWLDSGILN
jgi:hypothetical protein